jgi:hypothetical protein
MITVVEQVQHILHGTTLTDEECLDILKEVAYRSSIATVSSWAYKYIGELMK